MLHRVDVVVVKDDAEGRELLGFAWWIDGLFNGGGLGCGGAALVRRRVLIGDCWFLGHGRSFRFLSNGCTV